MLSSSFIMSIVERINSNFSGGPFISLSDFRDNASAFEGQDLEQIPHPMHLPLSMSTKEAPFIERARMGHLSIQASQEVHCEE